VKDGIYRATFKYHISPGYEPSSHSSFRIYQFDSKNSSESLIDKIKIEKCTKSTDWTPAPEDIDNRVTVTESSLTVLDNEISSVVGRVSDNETNISSVVQDVSSITSTVA